MINITDSNYEEDEFEYDDMDDIKINETKFIDNKPKKVLHTIDSVDYDRVTDESVKILESVKKKKNEEEVDLLNVNLDSVVVHIMMALAKIKSQKGIQIIIEKRVLPVLYWEGKALEEYFK